MSNWLHPHTRQNTSVEVDEYASELKAEDLKQPQPKALYAYWQKLRGERLLPSPHDINPGDIPRLLPYIAVMEVLEETPVDYMYRIEGEAIQSLIGFRRMGHRLSEFKERLGQAHTHICMWLAKVRETRGPVAHASVLTALNRSFYQVETLFLPLSKDGLTVNRILFCIGYLARPEDRRSTPPRTCPMPKAKATGTGDPP